MVASGALLVTFLIASKPDKAPAPVECPCDTWDWRCTAKHQEECPDSRPAPNEESEQTEKTAASFDQTVQEERGEILELAADRKAAYEYDTTDYEAKIATRGSVVAGSCILGSGAVYMMYATISAYSFGAFRSSESADFCIRHPDYSRGADRGHRCSSSWHRPPQALPAQAR